VAQFGVLDSAGLLEDLLEQISQREELREALGIREEDIERWLRGEFTPKPSLEDLLIFYCLRHPALSSLISPNGGTPPSYNIFDAFDFNNQPLGYDVEIKSKLILRNRPTKIGGYEVGYPIGVPASTLTGNSKWIEFYAKRGFDILTYKTVRTTVMEAHKFPNWVFIPEPDELEIPEDFDKVQIGDTQYWPDDATNITMANSFGIPSQEPIEWQRDVERAKASLSDKQVLIVSVTGTESEDDKSFEALAKDFSKAAVMAKNAGADIVELNFSCPNVPGHKEGDIYLFPDDSSYISKVVKDELNGEIPLFIKIGYLEPNLLAKVVRANVDYIQGIVAINAISTPVKGKDGKDVFPPDPDKGIEHRTRAGISGAAIRDRAQEVVKNLNSLREKHQYVFDILGVGGVMTSRHVQEYLDLGADGVLSCTGAWINTNLAIDTRLHNGIIPPNPRLTTTIGSNNGKEEVNTLKKEYKPKNGKEGQSEPPKKRLSIAKLVERITHSRDLATQVNASTELVGRSKEKREKKRKK